MLRHLPLLLALLLLAACSDGTGPRAVVGEWLNQNAGDAYPTGWWRTDQRLTLGRDGSYTWESTHLASWGRPTDKLLGEGAVEGTYVVRGDSLYLTPRRSHGWDYLTGSWDIDMEGTAASPYHATVAGRQLVLDFVSYSIEGAMKGRIVFRRD